MRVNPDADVIFSFQESFKRKVRGSEGRKAEGRLKGLWESLQCQTDPVIACGDPSHPIHRHVLPANRPGRVPLTREAG